jgi:hypothetical protein
MYSLFIDVVLIVRKGSNEMDSKDMAMEAFRGPPQH